MERKEIKNLSQDSEKTLDKREKIYYNSRPISEERHQDRKMEEPRGWMIFNNKRFVKK